MPWFFPVSVSFLPSSVRTLQTLVDCPQATTATLSCSTSGTGVVSLNGSVVAVDEVYAGLFASEVEVKVALPQGRTVLQVKTMSHYTTAKGWEVFVALAFPGGGGEGTKGGGSGGIGCTVAAGNPSAELLLEL